MCNCSTNLSVNENSCRTTDTYFVKNLANYKVAISVETSNHILKPIINCCMVHTLNLQLFFLASKTIFISDHEHNGFARLTKVTQGLAGLYHKIFGNIKRIYYCKIGCPSFRSNTTSTWIYHTMCYMSTIHIKANFSELKPRPTIRIFHVC